MSQTVRGEKFVSPVVGGKVNDGELRAPGFDVWTEFGHLSDGFPAEGTAKVTKEDE